MNASTETLRSRDHANETILRRHDSPYLTSGNCRFFGTRFVDGETVMFKVPRRNEDERDAYVYVTCVVTTDHDNYEGTKRRRTLAFWVGQGPMHRAKLPLRSTKAAEALRAFRNHFGALPYEVGSDEAAIEAVRAFLLMVEQNGVTFDNGDGLASFNEHVKSHPESVLRR